MDRQLVCIIRRMQKIGLLVCFVLALSSRVFGQVVTPEPKQEIKWIVRPPADGVREGDTARIELLAINAQGKTMTLTAPEVITGDLGEAGDRTPVELKRVGEPPKVVPAGGFVVVSYDMTAPAGVGEQVLRLRSPIEGSGVLRILAKSPTNATTATTTTVVAPEPLSLTAPAKRPPTTSDSGVVEFVKNKLSPHERMYFLDGNSSPSAKYQISFKYRLFNDRSDVAADHPWVNGFYLGYTQTSFWDINKDSAPFFDTIYRPEIFWATNDIRIPNFENIARFDFQTGVQHESNGKSGDDSRSVNSIYFRPVFTLGDKDALFFTFAPKAYIYISSLADNPDITHFRGYFDLNFIVGQADGLQVAILGRIGDTWENGSAQLDVSYPIRKLFFNAFDIYAHAQIYTGYGESLLRYNQQDTTYRFGISLVR